MHSFSVEPVSFIRLLEDLTSPQVLTGGQGSRACAAGLREGC